MQLPGPQAHIQSQNWLKQTGSLRVVRTHLSYWRWQRSVQPPGFGAATGDDVRAVPSASIADAAINPKLRNRVFFMI